MKNNAVHIQEFADELKNFSDHPRNPQPEDVTKILNDVFLATDAIGQISKQVEFFVNGDISTETFLQRYKALETELGTKLA